MGGGQMGKWGKRYGRAMDALGAKGSWIEVSRAVGEAVVAGYKCSFFWGGGGQSGCNARRGLTGGLHHTTV